MEYPENKNAKGKKRQRNLILHLHPVMVRKETIRFTQTFGLGGMSALLFLLQVFTGILLRFKYIASPDRAYDSILSINHDIFFGQFVRDIHHWSGILLVILVFLHLLRTFYTGAFYGKRRWNWVIGVCLMVLAVFQNFTGYLLPWDQLAYWAITVSTSILQYVPLAGYPLMEFVRGGENVNGNTLLIFYNFHTAILPLTIVILMAFHFWRVRKAGGVAAAATKEQVMVPSDPDLVLKELVAGLVLLAVVLILSVFINAPLQERADPALSPNPAKAPWYFMGIQELLVHFHPFFSAILIPMIVFIGFLWIPFLRYQNDQTGVWFYSLKGKKMTMLAALLALALVPAGILLSEYVFNAEAIFPDWPVIIRSGLLPFSIVVLLFALLLLFVRKRTSANRQETLLFAMTFIMFAYVVFSLTGIYFRGPGMQLMWPWHI